MGPMEVRIKFENNVAISLRRQKSRINTDLPLSDRLKNIIPITPNTTPSLSSKLADALKTSSLGTSEDHVLSSKLKKLGQSPGGEDDGRLASLRRAIEASHSALQQQAEVRARVGAQTAQAGHEILSNAIETAKDIHHTAKGAAEDFAFGLEEESRIREMCKRQAEDAANKCILNISGRVNELNIDNAIDAAADVGIAIANRNPKDFLRASAVRGVAGIIKDPDCRDAIRQATTNECMESILPDGYVRVSTTLPRKHQSQT